MVAQTIGEQYPELVSETYTYESPQAEAMETALQQGQGISEPMLYAAIAALGTQQLSELTLDAINSGIDFAGDGLEAYYRLARWALFGSKRSPLDSLKDELIPFGVRALYNMMTYQPPNRRTNLLTSDINVFAIADSAVEETLRTLEQAVATSASNGAARAKKKAAEGLQPGMLPQDVVDKHARVAAARFSRAIARNVAFTAQEATAQRLGFKKKRWITVGDERVRTLHRTRHGKAVRIGESFQTPSGPIRYPGDVLAPIHETANCRCSLEWL